ncbi:transposase [Corallococcus sp. M34]|uniref:transposase n=1 Tax=Citreicoccus inhibens TaxID=2849499 RepID=UPI001C24ACAF|nr:transposase [Citreicoccus inhibens]MBU8900723.1 transposase [Citreicoccus inhibens]
MKTQQKQDKTAERGRFSAKRKKKAVLRLLKGEELDALSRKLCVPAAVLSEWREKLLAAGESGLKSREPKPADNEVLRLKAMAGELMMKNELLVERARPLEGNAPGFPGGSREDERPALAFLQQAP